MYKRQDQDDQIDDSPEEELLDVEPNSLEDSVDYGLEKNKLDPEKTATFSSSRSGMAVGIVALALTRAGKGKGQRGILPQSEVTESALGFSFSKLARSKRRLKKKH